MHPGPLLQRHPPPIPLPAEMSRHSAAHGVVHVFAVLVHVFVADQPTARTFIRCSACCWASLADGSPHE
eukprot:1320368-Pleurochrysis_carterae.AAC.1